MRVLIILLSASLWIGAPVRAADLSGTVVAVVDGDTLTLRTMAQVDVKIRLAGIDTPESAQPYGRAAQHALAALVLGQAVRAHIVDTDRYGRTVAHIYKGEEHINASLVGGGAAWVYDAYNDDPALTARQAQARAARVGLWALADHEQVPPWEWRRRDRL